MLWWGIVIWFVMYNYIFFIILWIFSLDVLFSKFFINWIRKFVILYYLWSVFNIVFIVMCWCWRIIEFYFFFVIFFIVFRIIWLWILIFKIIIYRIRRSVVDIWICEIIWVIGFFVLWRWISVCFFFCFEFIFIWNGVNRLYILFIEIFMNRIRIKIIS